MEDFGKIFKKYRESRQLKLRDIASKELSTSQISRFENGESDLTITKFMHAIQLINMPIDEFMYTANNFKLDELNELLDKIVQYTSSRDIENLKRLIFEEESKECNNSSLTVVEQKNGLYPLMPKESSRFCHLKKCCMWKKFS